MDNRRVCIVNKEIYNFKLDYIRKGIINCFFKPSILIYDNRCELLFDTSSYVPLSKIKELSPYNFVCIILGIVSNIEIAKDYLINPNDYVISKDTIFVKLDNKERIIDTKFIFKYYPVNISENKVILNIINSLKQYIDCEGEIYMNDIYTYINNTSPTYVNLINHLINLEKEIKTLEKY